MTLGELTAAHLGQTVTFTDGGATYTGVLTRVEHNEPVISGRGPRTSLSIKADRWRHHGSYDSDHPCAAFGDPA